jgi:hypothetical protein
MIGKTAKVLQISPNGRPTALEPGSENQTRRTYSGEFIAAEPHASRLALPRLSGSSVAV